MSGCDVGFPLEHLPVPGCAIMLKPKQASPFAPPAFTGFFTTTSWSATAASCHPLAGLPPFSVKQDSSDFSCSLQTPMIQSCQLYPGCYMTTKTGSASYFARGHKRIYPLSTSLICPYEALITGLGSSALHHPPAEIKSPLFLIVHHTRHFYRMQHKAVCRQSLQIVCGRPFLFPC